MTATINKQIKVLAVWCVEFTHLSDEHLENQDAQAPPVDRPRVRGLGEHLGREELGRAAERAGAIAETHALLTQTEIGNLHVALGVQQKIVELQVAVDDLVLVQVL